MTAQKVLILGYGRLGEAFSRLYGSLYQIKGVRRSPSESPLVVQMPIQDDALRPHLEWANVIIFCPAPERKDIQAYRETYQDNMQFLLNLMGHRPASSLHLIILISSIGVYPRTGDRCWSETDHLFIATPFQEILLATEQAVASRAIPYTILRAGGLYGEGRGYHHRVMQQGYINSSEMSEQWISSVHQDDLCGVIDQVIKQKKIGTIYNLVDQSHLRKRELVAWMAREMELPIVSDGPPTDADSHRRICTTKVMEELGYQFRYPTIIEFLEERKRRDEKPRQRG
jgi:nucleoside-diphosphate-sugar epimerase